MGPGSRIFASRLVQVAANALVVLLVAGILGPEGQGYYSLTVALGLLVASLLAGGLGLAAVPFLRQESIAGKRILHAQLLWLAGAVLLLLLGAGSTLLPAPRAFFATYLGWAPGLGFVVAGAVLGILLFEIFSYDLLARGRLVVGSVINGGRAMTHLLLAGTLVLAGTLTLGRAVGLVAVAQGLGGCVVLAVAAREIRRHLRGVNPPSEDAPTSRAGYLSLSGLMLFLLRRGWVGQLSAVAYFLLLRLDQALLAHFRSAAEVGVYSVAVYLGEMLWLLPGALTPLLVHSAAVGKTCPDRDVDSLRAVRLGFLVTLAAGVPLYFLAGLLLPLLAGGVYTPSGPALRALLPGIIAFAPGAVLAGDFIGRGRPHWNTQASLITLAVNIAAGLVLIPAYGAVGAGWASTVAYACGSVIMISRFLTASGYSLATLVTGRP